MHINVRREREEDVEKVYDILKNTFKDSEHSYHDEDRLVADLRKSSDFVPELSLVAEDGEGIVGYILFTKIKIRDESISHQALAMAPVAVLPEYQEKGIGSAMINKGLEIARSMGYGAVVVVGSSNYYPKFGFQRASLWNIKCPFKVPDEAFMIRELTPGALNNVTGKVEYPKEFYR